MFFFVVSLFHGLEANVREVLRLSEVKKEMVR